MPIMDSELEGASTFSLIPSGLVNAHVSEKEDKLSKDSKAPMAQLEWTIDEGEHQGRKIKFDTIMLGGKTKDGKPQSLGNLCSFIYYTGYPWTCGHCGVEHTDKHSFHIGTKEDADKGVKIGQYVCPDCFNPVPKISHNTDLMKGQRCGLRVGSRKEEGGDREFNKVVAYTDLQE